MRRTCPAPQRVAKPFEAGLSVCSSACMQKPKSIINPTNLKNLQAPRKAAWTSLSPDDKEIATCGSCEERVSHQNQMFAT